MYKPTLKRQFGGFDQTQSSTIQLGRQRKQRQRVSYKDKERSLIPQAFFQDCKTNYMDRDLSGVISSINSCQYEYPIQIIAEITDRDQGTIEYNQQIFCFYKQDRIYFWQYDTLSFIHSRKFLKHCFDLPITGVYFKEISHRQFQGKNIKMVVIAFGHIVRFYRLCNFQKYQQNSNPYLQNMMIDLLSPDIVTTVRILYQQCPSANINKNSLIILLGDENGNLILYDFDTMKKYVMDSLRQKLKRKIQNQSYSQIAQILPYKQFVLCLVKRYYAPGSVWKMFQRIIRSPKADIEYQQKIQVYKIQLNIAFNSYYKGPVFPNCKIIGFKRHCQYSSKQLIQKIKGSFGKVFQKEIYNTLDQNTSFIQSLTLSNDYIQVMFNTGQSILVDQDISFPQAPHPRFQRPNVFGIVTKAVYKEEEECPENQLFVKSLGRDLMLFDGFVASINKLQIHLSTYSLPNSKKFIRSIKQYEINQRDSLVSKKNHYFILNQKSFSHLQKITPTSAIFLYCLAMNEDFPHKKYFQKENIFNQKIQRLVEYFGQTAVLLGIIQLFIKTKYYDYFFINLRIDLFELAARQVSIVMSHNYKQIQNLFESNNKNSKNMIFKMTKNIQENIWAIIFKIQGRKVKLIKNQWQIQQIQCISIVFQIAISQIYKQIKKWSPQNFCFNREQVNRIISYSKILSQIIQTYISKQAQINSKRTYMSQKNIPMSWKNNSPQQIKSLKINYCILTKQTLQKLIILLKVYDYVCEMALHGTKIPMFSDLLFNSNKIKKIQFAQAIIGTLGINNQDFIDNLITTIPQIPFSIVRKFDYWKRLHQIVPSKDQQNKTIDCSFEQQVQQITEILNQKFYLQIYKYYLSSIPLNNTKRSQREQKQISSQYINGVLLLLRSSLKKIFDLRQQQIKINNVQQVYSKDLQNYFGILQIPGLKKQSKEILQQISFLTKSCNFLIDQIFKKYQQKSISRQSILTILTNIRDILTIQVRKKIQSNLQKYKQLDSQKNMTKRQIFSLQKPNTPQVLSTFNFLSDQMTMNVTNKYG